MASDRIESQMKELTRYDNEAGYRIQYKEMDALMEDTVKELAGIGEEALDPLHGLLFDEDTWSCYYSLKIIRGIGSERSIPFLIEFLMVYEGGDHFEGYEEAMHALSEIGEPAVEPLLTVVRTTFEWEIFYVYLVGALTRIVDDRVYEFIKFTLEDYLANPDKYLGWFEIAPFMFKIDKHGKKETTVPLLRAILDMGHLNRFEKAEVRDTIKIIEDPEGWKESVARSAEHFKEIFEDSDARVHEPAEKVGRNQPCPCGSGNKFKYCCLKKDKAKAKRGKKHVRRRS